MELLIYCPEFTSRHQYVFEFVFNTILGSSFVQTEDQKAFKEFSGPKISYTQKPIGTELLFFKASTFLNQKGIEPTKIEVTQFGDDKVPFAVQEGVLPFDPFAASFYFLSRYEEYLPFEADAHLRFPPEKSLQYQLRLLGRPIIDEWALLIKNLLLAKTNQITFRERSFFHLPTIDIDRAFHYKANGILKNTARFIKAILQKDTERIGHLINTGLGRKKDPFDTYEFLHEIHAKYRLNPIFFFLVAHSGHKQYDVNLAPEDQPLQEVILTTQKHAAIGIHPSYSSNENWLKLRDEKKYLENLTATEIKRSRQHFLKLQLPKTYLHLQEVGITEDYTMGYASQVGFRAGTCTPFMWYDLQLEKQSHLKVFPFAVMDATLRRYLKKQPDEAPAIIEDLIQNVKMVNGCFCSLWHNESLSDAAEWKAWRPVYEKMLKASAGF